MPVRQYGPRSIRWRLGGAGYGPFDGGANARDAFTEIAPNELDASGTTNFTLDERGSPSKRNDCPTTAALAGAGTPPGAVTVFFYSVSLNLFLCQVGTGLYKAAPGAASWTAIGGYVASAGDVRFCDFQQYAMFTHPVDGVYSYDGTNVVLRSAARNGTCIAAWQNKLFVGGIESAGAGSPRVRIHWSGVGDITTWTSTDNIDIRDKDEKPLTALLGGSGLLAFKEDSSYRINDSTDGRYQTIDRQNGCVGALALCGSDDGIFVWGLDGLYRGNGIGTFTLVGDKLRPRFVNATTINSTTKPLIAGVYLNGRVYFAFPKTSTTIPDAIMEYNPRVGWLMEAYFNARVGPFASYLNSTGVPAVSFASASATIKDLYTSTTRTGFACSLTTGYVEPFGGYLGRILTAHPQLTVPGSASPVFGINYLNEGDSVTAWTVTLAGPTPGGTYRPRLQPRLLGSAYAVTVNDTAAPLNSLSVLGCELSALLTALR